MSRFFSNNYSHNIIGSLSALVSWRSPSNIALVKYWGKTEPQLPKNTSLSFTLSKSFTETTLHFSPKSDEYDNDFDLKVILDGQLKDDFKPKIIKFFKQIETYVPFVRKLQFTVETHNSFPHSSGIASSASSFAALSLCLMSIEKSLQPEMSDDYFFQKAAFLARLGSGSATRSIRGNVVVWGNHNNIVGSSDEFGVKFPYALHDVFTNYQDTILLVDKGVKEVSSSVGHSLMKHHPFAEKRFQQANQNIILLSDVLQSGDLEAFIKIVEQEALSLHAMMMTADPYFILMQPNTLAIIHHIWKFRKQTQIPVCFTLDAGANVHVLYPEKFKTEVMNLIENDLVWYCQNNQYICDEVGLGSSRW